jgi:type III secretion protein L
MRKRRGANGHTNHNITGSPNYPTAESKRGIVSDKKYFSLIYGSSLEVAPKGKVIESAAFSELLTSQELLERMKKEVEQYRQEVITECEELKEQARKEGFEEGYKAWVDQLKNLETEIAKVRQETQKLIMPIALKAAKKIVATELQTSPEAILSIVMSTLKAVAQHKKIVLYVNKADFDIIDANKNKIKEMFEQLESLSLRQRDDVEVGGCVIETEVGIINAQLQDRWRSLEAAFESLGNELKKGG